MWDESYALRRSARRDFRRLAFTLILHELLLIITAYSVQDALAA